MNNNLIKYVLIVLFSIQLCIASDEKSRISLRVPPQFPVEKTIELNGTFLPESSCYFTRNSTQEGPIIMGPCSPCVCVQVCNTENDECLYAHQHKMNSPQELSNKINELFTTSRVDIKPHVEVTLFTRTNENNHSHVNFSEGSHKARVLHIADKIAQNNTVEKSLFTIIKLQISKDLKVAIKIV